MSKKSKKEEASRRRDRCALLARDWAAEQQRDIPRAALTLARALRAPAGAAPNGSSAPTGGRCKRAPARWDGARARAGARRLRGRARLPAGRRGEAER